MSASPVSVSFDPEQTRAACRLWHPKGNSLTLEMIESLRAALAPLPENPRLTLVTIEGAGDDFSFGAHVAEHTPEHIGRVLPAFHRLIMDLVELPVPTASVVRGRCFGGGFELALATDFIFAAGSASFSLPEIALGVFPPAASVLLPWRAGGALATRTILTGERRDARAWERDGLVTLVTADADLERDVTAWCASHLGGRVGDRAPARGDGRALRPGLGASSAAAVAGAAVPRGPDADRRRRRGHCRVPRETSARLAASLRRARRRHPADLRCAETAYSCKDRGWSST